MKSAFGRFAAGTLVQIEQSQQHLTHTLDVRSASKIKEYESKYESMFKEFQQQQEQILQKTVSQKRESMQRELKEKKLKVHSACSCVGVCNNTFAGTFLTAWFPCECVFGRSEITRTRNETWFASPSSATTEKTCKFMLPCVSSPFCVIGCR
jgi:hypothetical protein